MIYPENFEQKIGFSDVRTLLKGRCFSTLGTEWVDNHLVFLSSHAEVISALEEADEFSRFDSETADEVENDFFDVREALWRMRPERTFMEEQDLFALKRSLVTIHAYATRFRRRAGDDEDDAWLGASEGEDDKFSALSEDSANEEENVGEENVAYRYPALKRMADDVQTFPAVIARIDSVLNKYGKVKDTASPELARLRRELEQTMRGLSGMLRSIVSQAQKDGYIDRDVSPTMRDGRLVIPVAPSAKRKIKGIVHDESATGRTVFIEPASVVDANNRVRELKAEEHREVIRILRELSDFIRPMLPDIQHSFVFLAHIDYLRALTGYARSIGAVILRPVDSPRLDWQRAYHPLLAARLKSKGEEMKPLDVSLPSRGRILLISGPNAGGKSVCLKTVALLQYMMQCGMPVPASEASSPGIFSEMFIDIGDEQSIDNDLSTYSSHLLHMKQMIRHCGERSLLLIDEFGSGTEPQIGGALAEGILHRFDRQKAFGIITTHYQNLKSYAEHHPSVINGAMLYDRGEMQPLFRLQIGQPGSSFAIEIARKTGLPADVIDYAADLVGKDYVLSDKYLQDIVRDKLYWEQKRRSIRNQERQLEETAAELERELSSLSSRRKEVMEGARQEAKRLVEKSNALIENTIRSIREAQAEKERTKEVRSELAEFKESLEREVSAEADERLARKMAKIQRRQQRKASGEPGAKQRRRSEEEAAAKALRDRVAVSGKPAAAPSGPAPIVPGSFVRLKGQNTVGRVDSLQGSSARVLFGMMYTSVPLSRLEPAEAPEVDKSKQAATFVSVETRNAMRDKKLHFRPEIDLRGMRATEAMTAVAYFIDEAIQFEQDKVRILHGTGTGALREVVRTYLATIPGVRAFRDEHVQFGGSGITVVELD